MKTDYVKGVRVCVTSLKNPGQWHLDTVAKVAPGYVWLQNATNRFHADTGIEARKGRAEHRMDIATPEQIQAYRERQEVSRLQNEIDAITRKWRMARPEGNQVEWLLHVRRAVVALDWTLGPHASSDKSPV